LNKINIAAVGAEAAHAGTIASLGQLTTALTTKITALTAAASINPLFITGAVIAAGIAAIAIATD